MSLSSGDRLGAYEILAPLGAGGMGEVYRARDTRLRREIAIKVLPEAFASDSQRLERFEREAQLLASLSHPNIAAIHGFDQAGGTHFLVLELVDGETLAERLTEGPLELEEALNIGRQIAEALEAAHERGIIHRDLKPSNVKLTLEGKVKVLDFGLAKALGAESASHDLSRSPTVTTGATREGVILGTAAYMSPEQARGKPLDKRTDIWSFGCVLYETLTGRQAFSGETVSDTIVAILGREPDWRSLPTATPPKIRDLLRRCLQKDPARRLRDIGDARIEIEEALAGQETQALGAMPATPSKRRRVSRPLLWAFAGLIAMASGWAFWTLARQESHVARAVTRRLVVPLPGGDNLLVEARNAIAISPDGSLLALAVRRADGNSQLFLRPLDKFEATPLQGTEGASGPFFSPDGQWIGFFSGGKLRKVSVQGGAPVTICDASNSRGASWGPDDTIVFTPNFRSGLSRVPAAGGIPQVLTTPDSKEGEYDHRWPEILPDGKTVLFTTWRWTAGVELRISALSLETGKRKVVIRDGVFPRYAPTGHIVFSRDGALVAVPFDLGRLEVTSPPMPVVETVLVNSNTGAAQFAFSREGSLAYAAGGAPADRRLVWVDRKGVIQPVGAPPRAYRGCRLSPDGQKIAVTIEGPTRDIWIYDITQGALRRLTFEGQNLYPIWTPDGSRLVFSSNRAGPMNLFWMRADGSGAPERLTANENTQIANSFSPDGRLLTFVEAQPGDLWVLPLEEPRKPRQLTRTEFDERYGRFSADGRWLAYSSDESGVDEIYVQPFPSPGGKWQISTEGGRDPVWARSGRELFYTNGDRIYAVDIQTSPVFSAGTPRFLFEKRFERPPGPLPNYDVSPDGQRFVLVTREDPESATRQVNVVLNWFEELKRRIPAEKN